MPRARDAAFVLRVVLGSAWAGLLAVLGLWVITDWAYRWPAFHAPCVIGGVTAVAMGQFVFAVVVADRLFPRVNPRLSAAVEIGAAAVWISGLLGLLGLAVGVLGTGSGWMGGGG